VHEREHTGQEQSRAEQRREGREGEGKRILEQHRRRLLSQKRYSCAWYRETAAAGEGAWTRDAGKKKRKRKKKGIGSAGKCGDYFSFFCFGQLLR